MALSPLLGPRFDSLRERELLIELAPLARPEPERVTAAYYRDGVPPPNPASSPAQRPRKAETGSDSVRGDPNPSLAFFRAACTGKTLAFQF